MAVVRSALELLYQPRCCACDTAMAHERPLCEPCAESVYPTGPACALCAMPLEAPIDACLPCQATPRPYARLVAPFRFGGELAAALRRLKFRDRPDIARQLSPLITLHLHRAAAGADVLVPVPLSWRRRFRRGYNQSDLLLTYARRSAGIRTRIERIALMRRRHTRAQPGLSARERARNVSGAFAVRPRHQRRFEGRRVLLFDDIATTCATLSAAARALISAGASRVDAMCVARAE